MAVATITLESLVGGVVVDSVVVCAPNDDYYADDIVLDTDPQGIYDTGFTVRTVSGAFEKGGRVVGDTVPIRELVLPFWLTKASRPRFQRLWGTPGNFRKVRYHYDGPSGRRSLTIRLAKEIAYTTEDGFDADIDDSYHAVVSAIAVNPNYEGKEDVFEWVNPGNRFIVGLSNVTGGTFDLTFGGQTATGIARNATLAQVRTAVESLSSVGAGNVTVTGTPGNTYALEFSIDGTLTGSGSNLSGSGKIFTVVGACIGWFEVWNPTDQDLWPEWEFDPAIWWQFPDFAFGQERKWGRAVGEDAGRMIVTAEVKSPLSVMSDPFMDTWLSADLSNFAGLMNGVEPIYAVPPYTGVTSKRVKDVDGDVHIIRETKPVLMPVVCNGPKGAKVTLRQRRFWSAESGLEA